MKSYKENELFTHIKQNKNHIQQKISWFRWGAFIGLLLGIAISLYFVTLDAVEACFPFSLLFCIFGLIIYYTRMKSYKRMLAKVEFGEELMEKLLDEIYPRSKIKFYLDLQPYDIRGKQIWKGRSSHGNPKYKYNDRWLRLCVTLADGSRLFLLRKVGVKTKSSSIVKEKRKMVLSFYPNPRCYKLFQPHQIEKLQKNLRGNIRRRYFQSMERYHCHAISVPGGVKQKRSQLNAQYTVEEIMDFLKCIYRWLKHNQVRQS